ncbi:DUF6193 family natural product biosynthesis protein [Streptomyces adustus]|uniref:DUF6193 family natural product biosynthesis protein n=1 Tax=Streptomyces adustus TaxID=1609272 RepID=UPI0037224BC7
MLEAAHAEPLLRQLFPWTAMGESHFGRCADQRWTWDIPCIGPGTEGTSWVLGPLRSEWVGQVATVREATAMVVDRSDTERLTSGFPSDAPPSAADGPENRVRSAELG